MRTRAQLRAEVVWDYIIICYNGGVAVSSTQGNRSRIGLLMEEQLLLYSVA